MRRQIGIKLRAQDTCNIAGANWHIETDARVAVAVKRNGGRHTNAQRSAQGYLNMKPMRDRNAPAIGQDEWHELKAVLSDSSLPFWTNGQVAWDGSVAAPLALIEGPVGPRSDHGRFELEFLADPPAAGQRPTFDSQRCYRCKAGPAD
jgi:hypothetical protein